jgi:DNA ligase-1
MMGLTTDEERAQTISDSMETELQAGFELFRAGNATKWVTPVIYKNRGGIAESWITIQWNSKDESTLLMTRTVVNPGKIAQDYVSVIKPTKTKTAMDRALTDVKKRITKKLRDAWCEDREDAKTTSAASLVKPMLLYKWEKQKHQIKYPAIMSVKADGVRAIYDDGKLYSRSGKVYDLPHISAECKRFLDLGIERLDGEICFEDPTVPLPEVIHAIAHGDPNLKFHIFDVISGGSYEGRFLKNVSIFKPLLEDLPSLRLINMKVAKSEAEVDAWYEACAQAGMEGIVVRNLDSTYEFGKRVRNVLKYKVEYEDTYTITGYQRIEHPEGDLVMFECKTPDGRVFEVTPAWKHEERRKMFHLLEERRAASILMPNLETLVEFRGLTEDNIPYHAVGKTKFKDLMGKF